ncbi:MAG: helix-turn-helix domain-containing protein [Lachnospiraceae bacterium]|nr:helix-turn-helix transcriptional regulator [Lachnospiraceae bacterium]MCR5087018.1 helix-turn-helix domain-containing protein [Lachnospiraceae bacterium]
MDRAEIGRIIKEARLAKKMTQSQVVGNFITRNMLSQIESGTAIPSIKTLEYLSQKLDISIHLLTPEDRKLSITESEGDARPIMKAKTQYRAGDYRTAAATVKPLLNPDNLFYDEACAVYAMSCLAHAKESGLPSSEVCSYAKEAMFYADKGFYSCREWKVEACCLVESSQQTVNEKD